jgi:hypothetical protein
MPAKSDLDPPPGRRPPARPFVGTDPRDSGHLRDALRAALDGRGRSLLLAGEGRQSAKTRLAPSS